MNSPSSLLRCALAVSRSGGTSNLGLLSAPSTSAIQTKRFLKAKTVRDLDPAKQHPPWPYKEIGYDWKARIYDYTKKRLSENSKLILVEGNIGSGKSTLAKGSSLLPFFFII